MKEKNSNKTESEKNVFAGKIAENNIGNYLRMRRTSSGYSQEDVCKNICSLSTYSRLEAGELVVGYQMIEAFLDRLKIEDSECEFVLDEEDYMAFRNREEIISLVETGDYSKAEEKLKQYQNVCEDNRQNEQFIAFWTAALECAKSEVDRKKRKELFYKALHITVPDYHESLDHMKLLGGLELECIVEIINCTENSMNRECELEKLYQYFNWTYQKEGFYPRAYRIAMQYYAECLNENGKYDRSIQICNEVLDELYKTSKVENRAEVFYLRAKAREGRGLNSDTESTLCQRDYQVACTVFSFYGQEKKAQKLIEYMEEKYGWEYIG